MRTTLDIREDLLSRAMQQAAREGRRLSDLVEEGLQAILAEKSPHGEADFDLPVSTKRGGTLPGVDITSNAKLLDVLDQE